MDTVRDGRETRMSARVKEDPIRCMTDRKSTQFNRKSFDLIPKPLNIVVNISFLERHDLKSVVIILILDQNHPEKHVACLNTEGARVCSPVHVSRSI